MKTLLPYFIIALISFGLNSCNSDDDSSVPTNTEQKELIKDSLYLVNPEGDTLQTGVPLPIADTADDLRHAVESWQMVKPNTLLKETIKQSTTFDVILDYKKAFYSDSIWHDVPYSVEDDTVTHQDPIVTKGRTVKLATSERIRLAPPVFKDNVVADIQYLSIDQGLVSSTVNDILIDSREIMWLATERGLVKYDGVYATTYSHHHGLPYDKISSLDEDENGNIWIGFTEDGFAKFDGVNLQIFDKQSMDFLIRVFDIQIDIDGMVQLASYGTGMCQYDGSVLKVYDRSYGMPSHKSTGSFCKDKDGNNWFVNFGSGVWKQDERGYTSIAIKSGISSGWLPSVYFDSKNTMWLGGSNSDFYMVIEDSISHFMFDVSLHSYILDFIEDGKGGVWMATTHHGVLHFDGQTIEKYGSSEGMPSNSVSKLYVDKSGRLWIGTNGGGLAMMNSNSFDYSGNFNGYPGSQIGGFFEHGDKSYYATNKGIAIEEGNRITTIPSYGYMNTAFANNQQASSLTSTSVSDIVVTEEGIIFGAAQNFGFMRVTPDLNKLRRLGGNCGGMAQNPTAVAIDQDNVVWGGASNGRLYAFTDSTAKRWGQANHFFGGVNSDIEIDEENNLWIGSTVFGLCKFDRKTMTYYTTNEGLSSNNIKDVFIDADQRIWVATEKGLDYIENDQVVNVSLPKNLKSSEVQSIIEDESGSYWLGMFDKLVYLEKLSDSKEWTIDDYSVKIISKNDGINNSSFLQDAMFVTNTGKVALGTEGGQLSRKVERKRSQTFRPTASIMDLQINGKSLDYIRADDENYLQEIGLNSDIEFNTPVPFYNYPTTLQLPFDHNHLTFIYGGTHWGVETPQRLEYDYYVEGLDDDWIHGTKDHKAEYRNIPYGDYVFHLRSYIDIDNPSDEFIYSFTILPPWYHTWWARVLFVLFGGLIIWLVVRWRTKALLTRQEELENTVEERTSELKEKHHQLEESHKEIQDSISYAKRIQSAILPPTKLVKEYLPESFILYKPKDIVAGDFYWMEHSDDKILFAAADCTGHGVPGAMVSVICNGGLNRSVNEFGLTDPGKILDKTRELVIQEFEKSEDEVKDGMDIALCSLKGSTLEYAGAHNALWIIRNGATEIEETKADKQPIGKYAAESPFTTHKFELNPGDSFYIFSDGYPDQFGGERGKKFKSANFKRLLLTIQDQSMEQQRLTIDAKFEEWKGDLEQVDDVCVIGVRV